MGSYDPSMDQTEVSILEQEREELAKALRQLRMGKAVASVQLSDGSSVNYRGTNPAQMEQRLAVLDRLLGRVDSARVVVIAPVY